MRLVLVIAGGAVGSAARYLIQLWMIDRFGSAFPWGTLSVNVAGSFAIGLIAALADDRGSIGANVRLFLVVGVLGGFTTFSSFSLETLRLAEKQAATHSMVYVAGSVLLSLGAAMLGMALARQTG